MPYIVIAMFDTEAPEQLIIRFFTTSPAVNVTVPAVLSNEKLIELASVGVPVSIVFVVAPPPVVSTRGVPETVIPVTVAVFQIVSAVALESTILPVPKFNVLVPEPDELNDPYIVNVNVLRLSVPVVRVTALEVAVPTVNAPPSVYVAVPLNVNGKSSVFAFVVIVCVDVPANVIAFAPAVNVGVVPLTVRLP